jgi:hypothetical protein
MKGIYFGDIEVMKQIPRLYAAISNGNSDLLVMNKQLVSYIYNEFVNVFDEMLNVAEIKQR